MRNRIAREAAWFAGLLFVGLVILPISIYVVGRSIFGEYGGGGLGDFYGGLLGEFLRGEPAVWFLLLSPYFLWQLGRLTFHGFRRVGQPRSPTR
jgi:hypothetical protein